MEVLSRNMELRYISNNPAANGETDFKGETTTLTTQQRVDYLNEYAKRLSGFFDDFSLDKPVVSLEEAKKRLSCIRPQPHPEVRKRLDLNNWKWLGYSEALETGNKADYRNGTIKIHKQDWRCFFECELIGDKNGPETYSFGNAVTMGFGKDGKPYYITESQIVSVEWDRAVKQLKMELDFVEKRFNLYLNDCLVADFVAFSDMSVQSADFIVVPVHKGRLNVSRMWGVGYCRQEEKIYEPFLIETFLDEDFSKPPQMEHWNRIGYDDCSWKDGVLPIVHGGERFEGQDLYLRKNVYVEQLLDSSKLYVESLTPGGEIYVNGHLAALIQNECCHTVDVTKFLRKGDNLFAVRVYADKVSECDKMTHTYTDLNTGWFAGRMHLDLLPLVYVEDVFAWTNSISEDKAVQKVRVSVKGRRGMHLSDATIHEIRVKLCHWFPNDSGICAQASWKTNVLPNLSEETEGEVVIDSPKLWTSDEPNLYRLTVELRNTNGEVIDDYVITTGIRTVSQEGGIFRINGKPEFLRAPLLFGARPPLDKIAAWDRCPPAEFYVQEMLMVKGMNGNGIRMSVHDKRIGGCNDPRICELADQLGIMLIWQSTTWLRITSATNLDMDELGTCIRQLRNFCSIVIWQPMNHPSWKDWDTSMRVYRMLSELIFPLDTSRLISPSADSRRMHPRWDDGMTDFEGNSCEICDPAWTGERICRGNMDYILGYGNEWSALRQWPYVEDKYLPAYMESTAYIPSFLNSEFRAYFNFEHDEIIGQPNWENHKGKPTYQLKSYEKDYDKGSIGRELSVEEWLTSQAWQALGAYETICKCRWLDYDGLCWCNLRGGANTVTYQKSLVDYGGQPKLAYYAHRMAFQNVLACSGNVDMVYGILDKIPVTVLNIGERRTVTIKVEVVSSEGTSLYLKEYPEVLLPEGRKALLVDNLALPVLPEGLYCVYYTIYGNKSSCI